MVVAFRYDGYQVIEESDESVRRNVRSRQHIAGNTAYMVRRDVVRNHLADACARIRLIILGLPDFRTGKGHDPGRVVDTVKKQLADLDDA